VLGNMQEPPLKRLRVYFEDLVKTAGQAAAIQGCLIGKLSLEVGSVSPLLQASLSLNFAFWQGGITSVLREAIEKGDLAKSTNAEALAGFVLNSWEGALMRSQTDRSDAPLDDFLHYVFEGILLKA
jgi:TetR/AcrR family transcriptional repressor of nem operon